MPSFHVFMEGTVGSVGGKVRREMVVHDQTSAHDAEVVALRTVSATGLDSARVTGVYPWTKGKIEVPYMSGTEPR